MEGHSIVLYYDKQQIVGPYLILEMVIADFDFCGRYTCVLGQGPVKMNPMLYIDPKRTIDKRTIKPENHRFLEYSQTLDIYMIELLIGLVQQVRCTEQFYSEQSADV